MLKFYKSGVVQMKQSIGSGRGSVYNIIMKALQSGDKYGYEICQEVEEKTNGSYILKQPSLYSGLKRLESQKMVESYWGDSEIGGRRHYYKLTELGKQRLEQSNFSWEDERNDLVENFFKKTEAEQNISDLQNELSSLTDILDVDTKTTEQIQNLFEQNYQHNEQKTTDSSIDEKTYEDMQNNTVNSDKTEQENVVISESKDQEIQKQNVINPTTIKNGKNSFVHKVNENQFDLFSFATASTQNNNDNNVSTQNSNNEEIVSQNETTNIEENVINEDYLIKEEVLNTEEISSITHENTNENTTEIAQYTTKENQLNENDNQKIIDNRYENENNQNLIDLIEKSNQYQVNANEKDKIINEEQVFNQQNANLVEDNIHLNENDANINEQNANLNENEKDESTLIKNDLQNMLDNQIVSVQQETDDLQFEEIFSRKRAVSFSDNVEENSVSPIFKTDLEKSNTYYGSTNAVDENSQNINDDFDEKYAQFQKMFEQDDEGETKEQKSTDFNDNSFNEHEKNEEELRKLQEIRMSEILSGNFADAQKAKENINFQIENVEKNQESLNKNNNEKISNSNESNLNGNFDRFTDGNSAVFQQTTEQKETKDNLTHGLNLGEIFKDIIDTSNSSVKPEVQNYDEYNNINFNTQTNIDDSLIKNNDSQNQEGFVDSLPRYDLSDNINFSLDSSIYKKESDFEKYNTQNYDNLADFEDNRNSENENTYYSGNFENEIDNFGGNSEFNAPVQQNFDTQNNLSFDKKQRMMGTNFNSYEIRYLRKNNLEQKLTKFTAINKLNLTTNLIISLIALIITAGLYLGLKSSANFSPLQKGMFIANLVIIVLFAGISSVILLSNKNKRIIYSFEKSFFVNAIFLGLLFSAIVLCSNLLFGMQMNKVLSYCGSFILPLVDALIVMLIPVLKVMLNKIPYYAK